MPLCSSSTHHLQDCLERGWFFAALLWALLLTATACEGSRSAEAQPETVPPRAAPDAPPPAQHRTDEKDDMTNKPPTDDALQGIDPRLAPLLEEPLPPGARLAFYYVNRGKNPRVNYRWVLHDDGRFFYVAHSGDDPRFQVPFDRPLPDKPTATLTMADLDEVSARLEEHGFSTQPAHQSTPGAEDGAYVVVRARREGEEHVVVYENVEPPFVEYLYTVGQ